MECVNMNDPTSAYQVLNHLFIQNSNFHKIEDYLRYYLLTSKKIIPYSYTILLAGIMKKRVINAQQSDLKSFDGPHAKTNIFTLMAITIYIHRMKKYHPNKSFDKCIELNNLIKIFDYYRKYIIEYIEKYKDTYRKSIQKSLSIFSKIEHQNSSHSKLNSNDNCQYHYCNEWIEKITNFFFSDNIKYQNNIVRQIYQDYCIIQFMDNWKDKIIHHHVFFNISIEELNEKYIPYPIRFFIE